MVATTEEPPTNVGAGLEDKCSTGLHDCSSNGTCIPLDSSYGCECNLGFEGDGRTCAGMLKMFVHQKKLFIKCEILKAFAL